MGRAFYPMTAETAVEDFEEKNRLDLPADRLAYEMVREGGRYLMRQLVLDDDGSVLASAEMPILHVLGSGNHSRSYLTGHDGFLYQMPVCWYPDKAGWDLCPGYELKNRFFTREADGSCLFCHNARVTLVPGTSHRYEEPLPHGIDCERCHGPGELHVALWTDPPDPPPDVDDTIVNPRKLPREARLHVCLQCHLGDADASERVERPGRALLDFRPGGRLTDFLDVATFDPPVEDRFALGGQGDRLILSRCYKESGGKIDCLTCHNPHVTVYARSRPPDQFRRACLGCHETSSCALPEGERRATVSNDDCAACHMRRAEPADQRFTAFTDHWIRRRVSPPGPPAPGRASLAMVPAFAEAHAAYPGAEPEINLARAHLAKKLTGIEGARMPLDEPVRLLRAAVQKDPAAAEAWFLLGKVALARGDANEAMGDFREALRLDPSHRSARLNLAAALLGAGRAAEAEPLLRAALEAKADDVEAMSDLGRALVVLGRHEEARSLFERGMEARPGDPVIHGNAGLLAARQGRHAEAADLLRRAGALDPSSGEVWDALAAALLDAGRPAEAAGPARRAARLNPRLPGAHFNLGRALAALGRREEAAASFREALRLDRRHAGAAEALAKLGLSR
jgi:Flp pilus assembly protein TadD